MKKKLKETRGEMLLEVLVSILVGALSVSLLFSAVMASGRMDRTTQERDDTFYNSLGGAEGQDTALSFPSSLPDDLKVTVVNPAAAAPAKIEVTYYGGDGALSFALPTP